MKKKAIEIFRNNGGQLRMSEAIEKGITRYMLYSMRDQGIVEQISRGVYRLAEMPLVGDPDLVTVALRIPKAVVCLISALSFHELTTQIPHEVSLAMPRSSREPKLDYPPTRTHRFTKESFEAGIEKHLIDGVEIRVYCPEKTQADCFKFRNKIGMDVFLEALKLYKARSSFNHEKILHFSKICRVEKLIQPYLEVLV